MKQEMIRPFQDNPQWILHCGEVTYLTCDAFDQLHIPHLFSTKFGGVSTGCFAEWNFAAGVGEIQDSEENVQENYERAARIFGLGRGDVCRTYQMHTDFVQYVGEEGRGIGTEKPKFPYGVDGLVTDVPNLLLSVRSADCVPILLFDNRKKVCAAVHSGWRGTTAQIVRKAIDRMASMGCRPADILAAIGPCIGQECYEVGQEVYDAFSQEIFDTERIFRKSRNPGRYMLDLTVANEQLLRSAGVAENHIYASRICTKCHTDLFFSHRAMGNRRGTMSAFIALPGKENNQ